MPAWGVLDAAYLAGFAAVLLTAVPSEPDALTITDALIERFGLLAIIVLGETLTGVVTGLASEAISGLTLSVGLVAVVVGFGAWWTYFDFAGHRRPRPKRTASVQWMLGHCRSRPPLPRWAPPWSAWSRERGFYQPLARTCAVVAVAFVGVGAARPAPLILALVLVVLLSIPWAVAVARRLAIGTDSAIE